MKSFRYQAGWALRNGLSYAAPALSSGVLRRHKIYLRVAAWRYRLTYDHVFGFELLPCNKYGGVDYRKGE